MTRTIIERTAHASQLKVEGESGPQPRRKAVICVNNLESGFTIAVSDEESEILRLAMQLGLKLTVSVSLDEADCREQLEIAVTTVKRFLEP
jgi:hypothetical protein